MPKVVDGASYLKRYSEEDIKKAIEAVQNGMPKKTAATKFGVPRPTLQFRLSSQFVKAKPGPTTILSEDEEKTLVEWIITCSRKGFPRRKEDVLVSVQQFLTKNPRPNCFINNRPGEGWYRLFLKRHPEISQRTAEAVTAASAIVSETNIRQWFVQIEQILRENNLMEVLQHPERVFNGDETNFQLCPKNTKVLSEKGSKNVYEVDHAPAKTCLTVMFTFSASGQVTPPMVIYPLKRMRADIRASVPSLWGIGLSDNGWMNTDLFFQYIQNIFYPYLLEKQIPLPVILFLDGHKSHLNYNLSSYCKEKGIILVALYPNSTRILQPADVSAFKPLKNAWKKGVLDWRRDHMTKPLTKVDFGPVLKLALENHMKESTIKNGFKACGLYPWNPNAIDYSKCLGKNYSTVQTAHLDSVRSEPSLTLKQFEDLIGPSVLNELQKDSLKDENENLFCKVLLKVHKFLSMGSNSNKNVLEKNNRSSLMIDNTWVPIDDVPVILSEDVFMEDISDDQFKVPNEEVLSQQSTRNVILNSRKLDLACSSDIISVQELVISKTTPKAHLLPNEVAKTEQAASTIYIDTFGESNPNLCPQDNIEISVDPCLSKINNEESQDVNLSQKETPKINTESRKTEQTPEKKSLKCNLLWPNTPIRKGKEFKDKPVYVLTSAKWLEIEKNKLDEKQKKEDEKQERKRKREEKSKSKVELSKKKIIGLGKIKKNITEDAQNAQKNKDNDKIDPQKVKIISDILIKKKTKIQKADIKKNETQIDYAKKKETQTSKTKKSETKKDIALANHSESQNVNTKKNESQKDKVIARENDGPNVSMKKNKTHKEIDDIFFIAKSLNPSKYVERNETFRNEEELAYYLNNIQESQ